MSGIPGKWLPDGQHTTNDYLHAIRAILARCGGTAYEDGKPADTVFVQLFRLADDGLNLPPDPIRTNLRTLLERWEDLRKTTANDCVQVKSHSESNHLGGRLIGMGRCITELRALLTGTPPQPEQQS